jgi:hypothetical protein
MATITGGTDLEERLAEIASKLSKPATLKVGFLENATYPDGKPVAMIAAIQNFGAPARNIPPRPFFSNMVAEKSPEWPEQISKLLATTDYDVDRTLALMGEVIKGDLQQSIRDTNSPLLSPRTVQRKGFEKPLIDTGHMINSVDYTVDS